MITFHIFDNLNFDSTQTRVHMIVHTLQPCFLVISFWLNAESLFIDNYIINRTPCSIRSWIFAFKHWLYKTDPTQCLPDWQHNRAWVCVWLSVYVLPLSFNKIKAKWGNAVGCQESREKVFFLIRKYCKNPEFSVFWHFAPRWLWSSSRSHSRSHSRSRSGSRSGHGQVRSGQVRL